MRLLVVLVVSACLSGCAAAPVAIPPGEYDLTTETVLPHLEEALRYATTRARRCLREPEAVELFPLLRHPAFTGCNLLPDARGGDGMHFVLSCANPEAASGSARFDFEAGWLSAELALKMGGKNMTLSQRVHGLRLGPCL
jgi:hypothetical protein